MKVSTLAEDCWIFQPDLSLVIISVCSFKNCFWLSFFLLKSRTSYVSSWYTSFFSIFCAMMEFSGFLISCETQALIMESTTL